MFIGAASAAAAVISGLGVTTADAATRQAFTCSDLHTHADSPPPTAFPER
jgi:hypothetical protein